MLGFFSGCSIFEIPEMIIGGEMSSMMTSMFRVSSTYRLVVLAGSSAWLAATSLPEGQLEGAENRRLPLESGGGKYLHKYTGQLSPTQENGICVEAEGVSWQRGAYGSVWIRLLPTALPKKANSTSSDGKLKELTTAVDLALEQVNTAVYVALPEAEPELGGHIKQLLEKGFAFHRFNDGVFVYYKWLGDPQHDMVPAYATSIEGVGAILLSPDESKVLLVWEYGCWKTPGGAVDPGESKLEALGREVLEEVGLAVDKGFVPVYLGGWHVAGARDRKVNDNFSTFAVRAAKGGAVNVDGNEITQARWFGIEELLALKKKESQAAPRGAAGALKTPAGVRAGWLTPLNLASLGVQDPKKGTVSTSTLEWLETYVAGKGWPCQLAERTDIGKGHVQINFSGSKM